MSRTVYYDHSGNEIDPPKADTVKPSNADRIRSMTDEELAFYIVNHPMWTDESACVNWLKEEVSE